jgi:hypothetical protein
LTPKSRGESVTYWILSNGIAIWTSARAKCSRTHLWIPSPNERCGFGFQWILNFVGFLKTVSSSLADAFNTQTLWFFK